MRTVRDILKKYTIIRSEYPNRAKHYTRYPFFIDEDFDIPTEMEWEFYQSVPKLGISNSMTKNYPRFMEIVREQSVSIRSS